MKSIVLPFLLAFVLLIGCHSGKPDDSVTEQNVQAYKAWVEEVLNTGNPEAAGKFLANEFTDHSLPPGIPGTLEGFKEWFRGFNHAFPDAHWQIEYIAGYDEFVVHHKTMKGKHTNDYFGTPATGKEVSTQETAIARYQDGKIVEFWGTFDEYTIARQIGLIVQPD